MEKSTEFKKEKKWRAVSEVCFVPFSTVSTALVLLISLQNLSKFCWPSRPNLSKFAAP